jgi:hypothetical protein
MTDREPDLLSAVDLLTKPVTVANWQTGHEHTWHICAGRHGQTRCQDADCGLYVCEWCDTTATHPTHPVTEDKFHRRTDPPLLDQLAAAVTSNIGGTGGGKQARERTPLDIGALTLYEMIDGRIRSWLLDLGAKPGGKITPTDLLRTWYVLWAAGQHPDGLDARHTSILESWATLIRDRLDPPKRIEIQDLCPLCGKEWMNVGLKMADGKDDPNDVERVRVLNAVEREQIQDSYAICSSCSTVWVGVSRMRQLRIALDDIDDKRTEAERWMTEKETA